VPINEAAKSDAAIRRKLRALAAVLEDPTTTEAERVNAERLKARLEKQLIRETSSPDTGTSIMFRLGRGVRDVMVSTSASRSMCLPLLMIMPLRAA
jgi:hypothetical protein